MTYFRMSVYLLLAWGSGWFVLSDLQMAFGTISSVIVVSGILNILSGFATFSVSIYFILYVIKEQFKLSIYLGNANKVVLIICFIVAPLLTIIIYQKTHMRLNENNYTECHDLQRISTRYISNTYTETPELCAQLVAEK